MSLHDAGGDGKLEPHPAPVFVERLAAGRRVPCSRQALRLVAVGNRDDRRLAARPACQHAGRDHRSRLRTLAQRGGQQGRQRCRELVAIAHDHRLAAAVPDGQGNPPVFSLMHTFRHLLEQREQRDRIAPERQAAVFELRQLAQFGEERRQAAARFLAFLQQLPLLFGALSPKCRSIMRR